MNIIPFNNAIMQLEPAFPNTKHIVIIINNVKIMLNPFYFIKKMGDLII